MFRVLPFVAAVMVAGTSMAEGVSTCPDESQAQARVELLPIQIVSEHGVSSAKPQYDSLLWNVAERITAKLGRENLCLNSPESQKRSLLQFVHWHLITREDAPLPPGMPLDAYRALELPLDARPSNGCRILSPWIDIAINRKPIPWVRAIVRWNERQFLADQAVLAGAKNVPPGVAKPLTEREYAGFAAAYNGGSGDVIKIPPGLPTTKQVEERIPPDILWLFRRSFGGGRGFFGDDMPKVIENGTEGYTKLLLALIDRCFASNVAELRYDSILDIGDPVLLKQYKIDMPIHHHR